MKKLLKKIAVLSGVLALALTLAVPVLANSPAAGEADPAAVSETQEDNTLGLKAIASGIAIGIAAGGGGYRQVGGGHLPPARGGEQNPHHDDAGSGLYRDGHHLRPSGRYSNYLRIVRRVSTNAFEY